MSSKKRYDPDWRFNKLSDKLIREKGLPDDFNDWEVCDSKGWTIAHQAALCRLLPYDFDNLELADSNGCTVAHVLAAVGRLPEKYNKWDLSDNDGSTVAHVVASGISYFPTWGAKEWGLKDNNGLKVIDMYKYAMDDLLRETHGRVYFTDRVLLPLSDFKELLSEDDAV